MDDALLEVQPLIKTKQTKYESLLNDNQHEYMELPAEAWRVVMNNLPGDNPVLNNLLINQFVADQETYGEVLNKFIEYLIKCPVDKVFPIIRHFVNNKKNKQNADICLDYFNKVISLLEAVNKEDIASITEILGSEDRICENAVLSKKLYQAFYNKIDKKWFHPSLRKRCCCESYSGEEADSCSEVSLMLGSSGIGASLLMLILFKTVVVFSLDKLSLSICAGLFTLSLLSVFIGRKAIFKGYISIGRKKKTMIRKLLHDKYNNAIAGI